MWNITTSFQKTFHKQLKFPPDLGGPTAETGNPFEDSGHIGSGRGDHKPENRGTPPTDAAEES